MGFYFVTFRSVTFAQRAERLLHNRGLRVTLMRTPRWMEEQGCGYALRFWSSDISREIRLLRENKIQLRRVYAQQEDGDLEEMTL